LIEQQGMQRMALEWWIMPSAASCANVVFF
jgi:hypothetical protein